MLLDGNDHIVCKFCQVLTHNISLKKGKSLTKISISNKGESTKAVKIVETIFGGRFSGTLNMCYEIKNKFIKNSDNKNENFKNYLEIIFLIPS